MNKDFLCKLREEGKLELSDPIKSLTSMEMLYNMGYVFNGADWVKSIEPRTKVVYEKVESLLSCIDDHIEEKLYNKVGDEFRKCSDCQKAVASTFLADCLYRKVDKEIDWREEVKRYFGRGDLSDYSLGYVIDRERVDAVSKSFIGMCHLVASLTDKPE